MNLDSRQERAVNELHDSGAVNIMVTAMSLRRAINFSSNNNITQEETISFRADMRAIRAFAVEVQAVINEAQ